MIETRPDASGRTAPETMEVDGVPIALRHREGASADAPGIAWLGGWRSDMLGGKAEAIDTLCADKGWVCLRHDYSGHGESGGEIVEGTISRWTNESLAVLDAKRPNEPTLLAGSSMGAWIALRMAAELARRGEADRLLGLLLVAPAPDFVTRLMEPRLTGEARADLETKGYWAEPSGYSGEPNVWTRGFMEDGRASAVLDGPLAPGCPVHIVQGTADEEVPLSHAELLLSHLPADEAAMTVVQGGDHRLSRDEDLALIARIATRMVEGDGVA